MTSTLIVPIDLTALRVGNADCKAAATLAPMADFSKLPQLSPSANASTPYLASSVLANAQAMQGETDFTPGVYLHWALPDALTAGSTGATGALAFPTVPNRWLLTRILQTKGTTSASCTTASWVIESDRLTAGPGQGTPIPVTVPLQPGPNANYSVLGAVFPLSGWQETTAPRLAPLTALGYGEPTFASFFPNCVNVFGYVDTLADVEGYDPATMDLAYQVSGWYANPLDDPLTPGSHNPSGVPAGWSFTGSPTQTVLSGMIGAVHWDPGHPYLSDTSADLTVAVANSAPEALAALLGGQLTGAEFAGVEQLLNAVQFGLLGPQGVISSLSEFEATVQAAGFGRHNGGTVWSVVPASSATADGNTGTLPEEVTLPPALAGQLNALNKAQTALDVAQRHLTARQWQLFTDWNKYLTIAHSGESIVQNLASQADKVESYLSGQVKAITAMTGATGTIAAAQKTVDTQVTALKAALPAGFSLLATPGPAFLQPHDPVLILSGADVAPVQRYGKDGAGSPDGALPCRLDSALNGSIGLAAGIVAGSSAVSLETAGLPGPAGLTGVAVAPVLQRCVAEAYLLIDSLGPSLVSAIASAPPVATNPAVLNATATLAAIGTGLADFMAGKPPAPVTYDGTAPDPIQVNTCDGTPWLPLLLQYSVDFNPVLPLVPQAGGTGYTAGFLTEAGRFAITADSLDLTYQGPAPAAAGVQTYTGTVVLTDKATYDLAKTLQSYLAATTDQELTDALPTVQGLKQLSQALGGLTQSMLMRAPTLQLPVADPLAGFNADFVGSVAGAVGGQTIVAPQPEAGFNPIRAGSFSVTQLRIVDVFGRWKDYTNPKVIVSAGLTPPAALALPAGTAFLPPRIAQPARLLFDWVSAADSEVETNSHPATSPIIAILVPNFLDRSLLIYTAAGTPLLVATAGSGSTVSLLPAPGGPNPIGTALSTVLAGQNGDLAAFAQFLSTCPSANFANLMAAIGGALAGNLPAAFRQSTNLAVLTGQPLVLARAALGLDLAGPAATDESWTSFAASVLNAAPRNAFGWPAVEFPVCLGDVNNLQDTLVGYFLEAGGKTAYSSFYVPGATAAPGVQPAEPTPLTVTPGSTGTTSTTAMLLLDPRGTVHATTGILPVAPLAVPPDQYAAALAGLMLSFRIGPALSGAAGGPPALALPSAGAGAWSWVAATADGWSSQALSAQASPQAALSYSPQTITDGWLCLGPAPAKAAAPTSPSPAPVPQKPA